MKLGSKTISLAATFAVAAGMATPGWAMTQPGAQEQEHHATQHARDEKPTVYTNNEFYRTGNREGYEDYQHHTQRKTHDHKYRNDDDRHAHDQGYQEGWSGHQYNENERPH